MATIKIDLTGKRIGNLVVVGYSHNHPKHKYVKYWKCLCDCGNEKVVRGSHLYNNAIKSCGCRLRRRGKDHPAFGGYEEISGDLMHSIRSGAKARHLECKVSIKYIWDLFLKQNRRCALSGVKLTFEGGALENRYSATSKRTASLDRIDSAKGYVEGNVQWIHKDLNPMKMDMDETSFIRWCHLIAKKKPLDRQKVLV